MFVFFRQGTLRQVLPLVFPPFFKKDLRSIYVFYLFPTFFMFYHFLESWPLYLISSPLFGLGLGLGSQLVVGDDR